MIKKIIICFIFFSLSAVTLVATAKKSIFSSPVVFKNTKYFAKEALPELAEDKARLFLGVSTKPISDDWFLNWDIKKLKVAWFSNSNHLFAFNILTLIEDTLIPFAKIKQKRINFPRSYYIDVDPQDITLAVFALNVQNFSAIQGLPGIEKITLEPSKSYQIAYGTGSRGRHLVFPNELRNITISNKQIAYCETLRETNLAPSRAEKRQFFSDLESAGLDNYSKQLACEIIASAKNFETIQPTKKMKKWAHKKQSKLIKLLERRRADDIKHGKTGSRKTPVSK